MFMFTIFRFFFVLIPSKINFHSSTSILLIVFFIMKEIKKIFFFYFLFRVEREISRPIESEFDCNNFIFWSINKYESRHYLIIIGFFLYLSLMDLKYFKYMIEKFYFKSEFRVWSFNYNYLRSIKDF